MKIAVLGSGAVGGYYGALLARAGHDVVFIARGAHLGAIWSHGLRVRGPLGDWQVRARAEHDTAVVGHVDLVLLAVTPRIATLHEAFVAADIQSEPAADGRVPLWEKFTYLAPFAGMTGAARQPVGVIRSEPVAHAQLLVAFAEVYALALAEGVPVAADLLDRVLTYVDGVPETMRSSLLIDLSEGKRIELEALQGAVVRRAAIRGVPVTGCRLHVIVRRLKCPRMTQIQGFPGAEEPERHRPRSGRSVRRGEP